MNSMEARVITWVRRVNSALGRNSHLILRTLAAADSTAAAAAVRQAGRSRHQEPGWHWALASASDGTAIMSCDSRHHRRQNSRTIRLLHGARLEEGGPGHLERALNDADTMSCRQGGNKQRSSSSSSSQAVGMPSESLELCRTFVCRTW
jgi:hypothetical protein